VIVRDCAKDLCCNSGKEDLAKCVQISCPLRSEISWICACIILREGNKREEELVDVTPGWG
jgi:hypothetical protein